METEDELCDNAAENDTVCTICNAEFLDAEDLAVHLTQMHPSESTSGVNCQFCESNCSDLDAYACHIRDKHIESLKLCTYCTKAFIGTDKLRKHERKHYSARKSHKKCSQCPFISDNMSILEMHEYESHNNNEDGILLHDISPILSSVFNIHIFTLLHSIGQDTGFTCVTCKFICRTFKNYLQHLRKNECRAFTCNNCSNVYSGRKNLIKHLQTHTKCSFYTKKLVSIRECPHCFKGVNSIFYTEHIKQCKPIKCMSCNIVFASMNELSEHQSTDHPSSIEVKLCKFCSRQCVGSNTLLKHMSRVHAPELHLYKYKCIECNKVFKHPQKLFAHYFINHKELEPYMCKICDLKFKIRKRFTIHIKLDHKSVGFVEFDKNYHVFFSATKSDDPFIPTCVIPEEELLKYQLEERKTTTGKKQSKDQADEAQHTDALTQTETDLGTEAETDRRTSLSKPRKKINTGRKLKRKDTEDILLDSSDDDKPLVSLTKKRRIMSKKPFHMQINSRKNKRKDLTCAKCNKYCYTYQNYQHHMSLHMKNENKKCIKCPKVFKSKELLLKHIETDHSSSRLTETLKSLIEKRRRGVTTEVEKSTSTERFKKSIKKVRCDNNTVAATIKLVENDLSLQKFIENFTPESGDAAKEKSVIDNDITFKIVNDPFYRKPIIKMTKFVPKPMQATGKLALPTKFKPDEGEKVTITMKLVQAPIINIEPKYQIQEASTEDYHDHYSDNYEDSEQGNMEIAHSGIPEVAEEVMLEGTEEAPKPVQIPHRIVIPKLPPGCPDISIAHLHPEAPYYKIVKVSEVLNECISKQEPKEVRKDVIKLADGTKMVTVNPLAHLMGDKKVEDILDATKNKYYKPKMGRNVEIILSKAIEKANTPTKIKKENVKLEIT